MAVWKVVGGAAKGGILVREQRDLKSPQEALSLATGSLVEEQEVCGDRLRYCLLSGSGPQKGWVSTRIGDRELLVPQGRTGAAQQRSYVVLHDRVGVRDAPSTGGKLWTVLKRGERVSGLPFKVGGVPWLLLSSAALHRLVQRREVESGHDSAWVLIDASRTELGHGELLRPTSDAAVGHEGASGAGDVDFRVRSLAGELCTLTANCCCPLRDLKVAIEGVTGIPSREQRLLDGASELTSVAALQRFMDHDGEVDLTLVRRPQEQAVWIEKVEKDWHSLAKAPEKVRADREVVSIAVKHRGDMLKHAAPELQADKEVVMTALNQDGNALRHVAESLRGNPDVVSAAVRNCGSALKHAPADFQADPEVVITAVRQDWRALHWAAPTCQAEPAVVLEAIKQDKAALDIVGEEAWADKRVMVAAIKLSGHAVTCPRWHPLRRITTRFSEVDCNECYRLIAGDSCLCCRRCDFDICDHCAKRIGQALVEEFALEE